MMQKLLLFFLFLVGCVIGVILTPYILDEALRPDPMASMLPMVPECYSLPEQRPENAIALIATRLQRPPGLACVRVYNGTPKVCDYTPEALRLEGRWFGFVWFPYFGLSDILSLLLGIPKPSDISSLPPGASRDFYLPSHRAPVSAGTYRVRLQYRVRPDEEEYTVYSEAFVLP
jgi:hypothetical protein